MPRFAVVGAAVAVAVGVLAGAGWTGAAESGVSATMNGVPLVGSEPRVPGCAVQLTVNGVGQGTHDVAVVVAAMEPSGTGNVVDVDAATETGSLSVGPYDLTSVVTEMGLRAAGNGYHLRAIITVDSVQAMSKPFWLACGRPQHPGSAARVTFAVSWRHLGGTVTSTPPAGMAAAYTLTATSSHGTATCTYSNGATALTCAYPVPEEGSDAPPSLQVSGMGSYVVSEVGVPQGWAPDPTTVGVFAANPSLPGAGTGGGDEGMLRAAATAKASSTVLHTVVNVEQPVAPGYRLAFAGGAVVSLGSALGSGSMAGSPLNAPIVGVVSGPTSDAYWLVAADGGVFTFGRADFVGSLATVTLNAPVVGMASTPDGGGYWLAAADGGVFAFGNAPYRGSMGGTHLNAPVVGMATTPDGGGYWLVASDGGIFAFGDAVYRGSMGGSHLNAPVVGMASTPDGGGYWLVASDGGIFAFGDAVYRGSMGGTAATSPIVGMAATRTGGGYLLTDDRGRVTTFGDASAYRGLGVGALTGRVIGIGAR